MKPLKIACLLGLVVALTACSDNDSIPLTDGSNIFDPSGIQDDEANAPILSVENYTAVASYALQFYAERILPGPAFTTPSPQDYTQPDNTTTDPDTGIETVFFTCSNGGTATRTGRISDSNLFEFDNCQIGDSILNGQLGYDVGKYSYNREFIGFTANVNGGTAIHTVAAGKINNYSGSACSKQTRTRSVPQYTITQADQLFELKDWDTSLVQSQPAPPLCDTSTLEISGQYSVSAAETGNNSLAVSITDTVTGTAYSPNAGMITISAEDASMIAINFATDDDNTVQVTITNSSGESIFDEPSTAWIESLLRSGLTQL